VPQSPRENQHNREGDDVVVVVVDVEVVVDDDEGRDGLVVNEECEN
jgi:hypothetical protein